MGSETETWKAKWKAEPDYSAEMKLAPGDTCADCIHGQRCDALFGAVRRKFTSCDFWPNRFERRPRRVEPDALTQSRTERFTGSYADSFAA